MTILPGNASELADIAEEVGAHVLSGALHYPSITGGWQLGDVDLGEHLAPYQDKQVMLDRRGDGPGCPQRDLVRHLLASRWATPASVRVAG